MPFWIPNQNSISKIQLEILTRELVYLVLDKHMTAIEKNRVHGSVRLNFILIFGII